MSWTRTCDAGTFSGSRCLYRRGWHGRLHGETQTAVVRSGSLRRSIPAFDGISISSSRLTRRALNGRLQAFGSVETWDDNPRATLSDASWASIGVKQPGYEPVELPAWMSAYASAMERMAGVLKTHDRRWWKLQVRRLNAEVDDHWSDQLGGWFDRRAGQLIDVRTPIMWWPAALGTTKHPARARRVVQEHALNPFEFAGFTPTPSVAVTSPFAARAQALDPDLMGRFSPYSRNIDGTLYDWAEHGAYWQGQSWLILAYGTLLAMARTGHIGPAESERRRLLEVAASHGGIYEAYDAMTGDPGLGPIGGLPAAFGCGWSAAVVAAAAHRRYQP